MPRTAHALKVTTLDQLFALEPGTLLLDAHSGHSYRVVAAADTAGEKELVRQDTQGEMLAHQTWTDGKALTVIWTPQPLLVAVPLPLGTLVLPDTLDGAFEVARTMAHENEATYHITHRTTGAVINDRILPVRIPGSSDTFTWNNPERLRALPGGIALANEVLMQHLKGISVAPQAEVAGAGR